MIWMSVLFYLLFVYSLFSIICMIQFIVIIIQSLYLSVCHALMFPSNVSVFSCDLSPSTPESVSSHSSVISGFMVFFEDFFRISFYGIPAVILICLVINSPSLCSS